jgi:branched-chain amino acid aminotransferase
MGRCVIRVLTPDGNLHPVDYEADSLASAAAYEPDDGVYTVTNTYHTIKTLYLDAHLDRLDDSARRAGIPLTLDRALLRRALRQMIKTAGYGDVRFRITVPRSGDHLILSVEPFTPITPEHIRDGVRVITVPNSARQDAATKSTGWMHQRRIIAESLPPDVYDAILLDASGHMMEGLGANFYAIIASTLYTAGEGVLKGIAQRIIFEVAPGILPVEPTAPHIDDLPRINEAFITSSSRGIVPVVQINEHILVDGTPGHYTRALLSAYRAWVENNLQTL